MSVRETLAVWISHQDLTIEERAVMHHICSSDRLEHGPSLTVRIDLLAIEIGLDEEKTKAIMRTLMDRGMLDFHVLFDCSLPRKVIEEAIGLGKRT